MSNIPPVLADYAMSISRYLYPPEAPVDMTVRKKSPIV
jgi:hypothetical protein